MYPATLTVVKYSPGPSCKNRTPCDATGSSKKIVKSLAKQKHTRINAPTATALTNARSLSSSRCSQIVIDTSSGSSSSPGYKKLRTCSRCTDSGGAATKALDFIPSVVTDGVITGSTVDAAAVNAGSSVTDVL